MTADITSVVFLIFSPNNDGVNDVFLEGYNLPLETLYIGYKWLGWFS